MPSYDLSLKDILARVPEHEEGKLAQKRAELKSLTDGRKQPSGQSPSAARKSEGKRAAVTPQGPAKLAAEKLRKIDTNGDGKISNKEFLTYTKSGYLRTSETSNSPLYDALNTESSLSKFFGSSNAPRRS